MEILKSKDLTNNQRNSVLFRSGEKEILRFLINMSDNLMPLLDMDILVTNIHYYLTIVCIESKEDCTRTKGIRCVQRLRN